MKVTFVYPRASYFYDRTPYLPLGIAYLAANIQDVVDGIECVDGNILSGESYEQAIATINSDLICISATLLQMKEAARIANEIKARHPSSQVVIGGYGPHSLPLSDLFQMGKFDIFVKGEGELTLREVVDCLKRDGDLGAVSNLVFAHNNEVISTKPNPELLRLDSLPLPDRTFFDVPSYQRIWKQSTGMTSLHMITSRGCPFDCTFCDKTLTGRKYRSRAPKLIVDEMEQLWQRYQPDDIFLFDDLFTLRREQVLRVCREIKQRGLSLKWSAQGRVGLVNLEVLSALKDAGCAELFFGVESGSNRILSFFKKGFTREQVIKTFAACQEVGLRAGAYLIVGVPGETKEDIDLTIDLMQKIKPSLVNFSFLTPFPNTQLHQDTAQWIGQRDWTQWDDFTKTVYNYPFEVDPRVSRQRILQAYKRLIEEGMDYSPYQLLR
jgi:anaerobic magnesium-protoporphyrin IX monomethyl ester cyclase